MPDGTDFKRSEISVYWTPGCSMCLNTKEFLEARNIPFESLNVLERTDAMEEVMAAGFRGMPVVRKGDRFTYVQSLDVVAQFLDLPRGDRVKLSQDELLDRWEGILTRTRTIVFGFDEELLTRRATLDKPRPIRALSSHVFQIPEVFVRIIEEGLVESEDLQNKPRADIVTRDDLTAYIDKILSVFQGWRARGGAASIPRTILTYYGEQPSYLVLERAVWHSAQHARQLDTIAAGLGAEFRIPVEFYQNLPMPKRLWM